jgi:hypothetical protein
MTLENQKILYKHFIETGQKERADEIARGRPEVIEEKKEIKSKKEK